MNSTIGENMNKFEKTDYRHKECLVLKCKFLSTIRMNTLHHLNVGTCTKGNSGYRKCRTKNKAIVR